jgi:small subunit ribosomal protein S8
MDVIANMLVTLVNAQKVSKERVAVPYSKFKENLISVLQKKGVVTKMKVKAGVKPKLVITLAYDQGMPKIVKVHRVSKPGCRVYVTYKDLPHCGGRPGFYVVSTSQGLMDEREAREKKLGGEIVCVVWKA